MELRDRRTEVVLAELQQVRIVGISGRPEDHVAVSGALAIPAVGDVGTIVAINATPDIRPSTPSRACNPTAERDGLPISRRRNLRHLRLPLSQRRVVRCEWVDERARSFKAGLLLSRSGVGKATDLAAARRAQRRPPTCARHRRRERASRCVESALLQWLRLRFSGEVETPSVIFWEKRTFTAD
jgi:hypothetical protein